MTLASSLAAVQQLLLSRCAGRRQVSSAQVEHVRYVCQELFGYRLDMASRASKSTTSDTSYVLRPKYAQAGAELLFHSDEKGVLSLLPTAYSSQKAVAQQVAVYIDRRVPARRRLGPAPP